jgi:hypothetical protein
MPLRVDVVNNFITTRAGPSAWIWLTTFSDHVTYFQFNAPTTFHTSCGRLYLDSISNYRFYQITITGFLDQCLATFKNRPKQITPLSAKL